MNALSGGDEENKRAEGGGLAREKMRSPWILERIVDYGCVDGRRGAVNSILECISSFWNDRL